MKTPTVQLANTDILKELHGTFESDLPTQRWRVILIVLGWIVLPCVSLGGVLAELPPETATVLLSFGILTLGLSLGYMSWIVKKHRYRFEDGNIESIGRKILWRLPLKDIESIRVYRSGNLLVWWLKTKTTERGLRIYPSLEAAIKKIAERSLRPDAGRD